jgi:orotate phosphoribosyltransferase
MSPAEVLALFRASGALLEGHFELSSGRHAQHYFQCALLLAEPGRAEELARAVVRALPRNLAPDVVVGPALGAVVWAHELGRALGRPAFFTERTDGAMALRRGFRLARGQRVLVVEDVLTTGGSVREVLAVVRASGAVPVGVAAIVNRSAGPEPFADEGLPFTALAHLPMESWEPRACPVCAAGGSAAVKPGSRARASAT